MYVFICCPTMKFVYSVVFSMFLMSSYMFCELYLVFSV